VVFSDPVFLYVFLPVLLVVYWAAAWRIRNLFLCLAGGIFYMWGGGAFIVLLLASIVLNHSMARLLARLRVTDRRRGSWVVRATVIFNLIPLAVWKYGEFAVAQFQSLVQAVGIDAHPSLHLALPIAISFYTFQCISYIVDVWRGTAAPASRLLDYAAYMLLFPHLIAGPIVRYADIEHDLLQDRRRRLEDFAMGAPRFFWGLGKKVLIADQVAAIVDKVFSLPDNRITTGVAWVGVLAYAVQIYFDFSGYSDMAIGLARMFGFSFPENFSRPYSAVSITDFWRRWHMSLSTWFRDYVYIPLGGNRRGQARTYANLACIFLFTGLWHGANWTFIVWGVFHGVCLIVERRTGLGALSTTRLVWLRRIVTFVLVCLGWAIFRAGDIGQAWAVVRAMVVPSGLSVPVTVTETLSTQRLVWFAAGLVVALLPTSVRIGQQMSAEQGRGHRAMRLGVLVAIAPLACLYALSSSFSPFLYFKF
jgi:alginate O-acetyltransferase complex protein AlgI